MYLTRTYPYPDEHFDVLVLQPAPGSRWLVKVQLRDENDAPIGGLRAGDDESYDTEQAARDAGVRLAWSMIRK